MTDLEHLKAHLTGKVVILGIGNALRSDDAAGSFLASRIKGKVPYTVYDAGPTPENYLGKIIKEEPEHIVLMDAADFGAAAGTVRVIEGSGKETPCLSAGGLFFTHDASLELTINYLKSNLKADIIILIIQPKSVALGDEISPEVAAALSKLEEWFYAQGKEEG